MRFWKRRKSGKGEESLAAIERRKWRERNGFFSRERTEARRERIAKLFGIFGGQLLGTSKIGWALTAAIVVLVWFLIKGAL